ncbi:hypothetical protein N0V85_007917 [Neurospora sp. IMI 360204]|nr:hypothetical protein N0V85_007917 [Neurospora sp. IMI 360204]
MKFLFNLFTLTALSWCWSLPALAKSHLNDFTLPDRQLLRALARRQHSNGTSLSEFRALGLVLEESHIPSLEIRQTTGRCGANYGRCPDNLCCSDYARLWSLRMASACGYHYYYFDHHHKADQQHFNHQLDTQ